MQPICYSSTYFCQVGFVGGWYNIGGVFMVWCTHFVLKLGVYVVSKVVTYEISLALNSALNWFGF